MNKEDVIFSRKEFLNLPGLNSMANIITAITKWRDGDYEGCNLTLNIADCDRKVCMHVNLENEYQRENALFKIDTLIDVLQDFRGAIEKYTEENPIKEKDGK